MRHWDSFLRDACASAGVSRWGFPREVWENLGLGVFRSWEALSVLHLLVELQEPFGSGVPVLGGCGI